VSEFDYPEMDGIEPRWYANVSGEMQSRLVAARPNMRVLWNNKAQAHVLVARDPACAQQMYDGSHVRGWSIAHTFQGPMVVDQLIAYAQSADRWTDEWLDRWAPKMAEGVPSDETLMQRADRGISNYIDAGKQAEEERQQQELSDLVEDSWPDGKVLIGPGNPGSHDIKDWMLKSDERVYSAMKAVQRNAPGSRGQLERVLRQAENA